MPTAPPVDWSVERHQIFNESVLNLLVREAECVVFKLFIVTFYGEVATLIYNG
jgi:hypothetical protein